MTTNIMNSIDTIRKLNVIVRKYYHNHNDDDSFNHEAYIGECLECLQQFFLTELFVGEGKERENAYLFSALTFKREDSSKIELVEVADDDGVGYHFAPKVEEKLKTSFKNEIVDLYDDIHAGRSMSVTTALLRDKRKGKDLFFFSKDPYPRPVAPGNREVKAKIAFFSLSTLKFSPNCGANEFWKANLKPITDFRRKLDDPEMKLADSDQQIGTLLWHYKRLETLYLKHQGKQKGNRKPEFLVHFIRPSFIEFGHNILLSLGTTRHLNADQLSLIYLLVYRIISQTVIEKTKEVERLKRRTSFSLTTHALKTELDVSILPKVEAAKKQIKELGLPAHSGLSKIVVDLEAQYIDLFCLTAFVSLIDKVENQSLFEYSGLKEGLLAKHPETIDIARHCKEYNKINQRLDDIKVIGTKLQPLSIKVYNSYFSKRALRLFMNTILENLNKFGRRTSKKVELRVTSSSSHWTFENETNNESVEVDPTKIRGNLYLFTLLIEKTGSGKLTISPPGNHKFEVSYRRAEERQ